MFLVVGDLTHANVLNIFVLAFFNHHLEIRTGVEQPQRKIFLVMFSEDLVKASTAHVRALSLPSPTLFDFRDGTTITASILGQFEPTVGMRDLVDFHIKTNQVIPVPHAEFIHPIEVIFRKANDPQDRTGWNVVSIKLLPHNSETQFQGSGGVFMENMP
jgi:hypothetical protein